tara:strand:+ start:1087 stop:1287 length:201 start_codon:yes stop_codon:yes gene_type:complete
MTPAFVRRAWLRWEFWRARQALYRACPERLAIDDQERAARALHKPVREHQKQRQAIMHDLLRKAVR